MFLFTSLKFKKAKRPSTPPNNIVLVLLQIDEHDNFDTFSKPISSYWEGIEAFSMPLTSKRKILLSAEPINIYGKLKEVV